MLCLNAFIITVIAVGVFWMQAVWYPLRPKSKLIFITKLHGLVLSELVQSYIE